jgi:hypothetical protein
VLVVVGQLRAVTTTATELGSQLTREAGDALLFGEQPPTSLFLVHHPEAS